MDINELIGLIESEPESEKYLYFNEEDNLWWCTSEWLCGSFAGRGFFAATKQGAAEWLAEYFDEHVGHDSIVGRIVSASGWPDLKSVKRHLDAEKVIVE
ncbi:hypothetical protein [Litorivivens sp.]|uniref:hypothetical protein n=1 Tax=Litorivivens sp. TaxID=2020868 RepID=UPI0035675A66